MKTYKQLYFGSVGESGEGEIHFSRPMGEGRGEGSQSQSRRASSGWFLTRLSVTNYQSTSYQPVTNHLSATVQISSQLQLGPAKSTKIR